MDRRPLRQEFQTMLLTVFSSSRFELPSPKIFALFFVFFVPSW
jgi:hypothetical protein